MCESEVLLKEGDFAILDTIFLKKGLLCKAGSKNGAARNFFGPIYFVTDLIA